MKERYLSTAEQIHDYFPFEPTQDQKAMLEVLSQFLHSREQPSIMLLKGYAGTGKTTTLAALVKFLQSVKYKTVLLAPTGRAAKVMASYTGQQATTIHRKVYFTDTKDGHFNFKLQTNKHKNTFFIVDEASMISDQQTGVGNDYYQTRRLLDDLISYVYNDQNSELILVGDTAQLPPVGLEQGQALDSRYLKNSYHCEVFEYELTEVVRQAEDSGILSNATDLRQKINSNYLDIPLFDLKSFTDIRRIDGNELEEELNQTFLNDIEESIFITRSNKRANLFNQEIRRRILYRESRISSGDLMMVVRNNYFWLPKHSRAGFIANGDVIEILNLISVEEMYGFTFADVRVRLIDYPEEKDFEVKIILDVLEVDAPNLPLPDRKNCILT